MTDQQIIELYFRRSERAIEETAAQYGKLFYRISYNILHNREDSEECVSDTYFTAWNLIPPKKPTYFSVFLSRITRSLSIDKWRRSAAAKRGGGQLTLAVEELDRTLASDFDLEESVALNELTRHINNFLNGLKDQERRIFICRYWYMDPVATIANNLGISIPNVKTTLSRTRKKLKVYLVEKGGYEL